MSHRLPRFNRAPSVAPIQLTARDKAILRLVHEHRFLRSSQIISLLGGSSQQILRRLKSLYHHSYLERPRAQLEYYYRGGSREIVYGLGNKGAGLLTHEFAVPVQENSENERNGSVRRLFLEHALLVSDVMVAIELACRGSGVRFISEETLLSQVAGRQREFKWQVKIYNGVKLTAVPDRVFGLEYANERNEHRRAIFFVEADRGTMPVIRKTLSQTSFYRKLIAYEATWLQSIHRKRFGFDGFRVWTITTSTARINSLRQATLKLKHGRGLFLFADQNILETPDAILDLILPNRKRVRAEANAPQSSQ